MNDSKNYSKMISTILKHDRKQTTYKIALIRAINDIVIEYAYIGKKVVENSQIQGVVLPLYLIAEFWFAYYWGFVADEKNPILQSIQDNRDKPDDKQDISFRHILTDFRKKWEQQQPQSHNNAEGFYIRQVMKSEYNRKYESIAVDWVEKYNVVIRGIKEAVKKPIEHASISDRDCFPLATKLSKLKESHPNHYSPFVENLNELCLFICRDLWIAFQELSLWIESLCIHEWCLFVASSNRDKLKRGEIYEILTEYPQERESINWIRIEVNKLLDLGCEFQCPWSKKVTVINVNDRYDIDHIIPVSLYPINKLWNLIPTSKKANRDEKRDKLPSAGTLAEAKKIIKMTYANYLRSEELAVALFEDVKTSFQLDRSACIDGDEFIEKLVDMVCYHVNAFAEHRNVAQF